MLYYIHKDNDNKRMKKADKVVSMFESHHSIIFRCDFSLSACIFVLSEDPLSPGKYGQLPLYYYHDQQHQDEKGTFNQTN